MIKPESNAPSPMKPWVRTTDKQIEDLESAVARVESVLGVTSGNIDYELNQGLTNTFSFTPVGDGSTETTSGAMSFTGDITSDSNISLAGTLIVGDPSRQEYNEVTGEAVGQIPTLEVIAGQIEINPVTEVEYYTTGQLNTTDTFFNINGYGSIAGDGMQITLSNDGEVERQNIQILDVSGSGTEATFEIENNTSNVAVYTAGRYVNISGVDPDGYNGTNLLITSVNTGVSPMTFTVASEETGTYVAGGYVTINQPNSIYEGKLSVRGPAPEYTGVTIDQDGVHVGTNGGDPAASDVLLDSTGLTAPNAFIDQAVINGTRFFISDTEPTAVNDGDIWLDKTGIFSGGTTGVTSVGLSLPSIFTVTNSPVTTTGDLTATLASQAQQLFLSSPTASAGTPTFRYISTSDFTQYASPTVGQALVAAPVTGGWAWTSFLPLSGGSILGTLNLSGSTSPLTLQNNAGTSGQVLTSAGSGATPTWTTPAGSIKMATGRTTSTTGTTALTVNTGETFAITFPVGRFTVSPSVTVSTSSPRYVAAATVVTTSGFTLSVRNVSDATGTTYLYHWQAIEVIS